MPSNYYLLSQVYKSYMLQEGVSDLGLLGRDPVGPEGDQPSLCYLTIELEIFNLSDWSVL